MSPITRSVYGDIAAVVAIVALLVFAWFWSEARKEVTYLCGNFYQGITKESVRRQLDTANLLRYRTEFTANGSKIVADSLLHIDEYACTIWFSKQNRVTAVNVSKSL
ncbi:hypothetical protein [Alteromonas antoniana]|uniref:hypothetical protein n=1 Tax=Alteromonas antoniana TaxID=2803813 RepID=UPI001C47CF6C|nr:hypothetical protein [Alteromonas antoniana]